MADNVGDAMRTAAAAYRRFAERAARTDCERATSLAGWTVGDLIDHVAWGAAMEASAVRAAVGLPTAGAPTLDEAVAVFCATAELDVDAGAPIALPAGTVPFGYAAPLFAFEAALHDLDLARALGSGAASTDAALTDAELTDAELAACEIVLGPMLDLVAGPAPEHGVTIDLLGLGAGVRLRAVDGGWRRAVPDGQPPTTTVVGSAQDVVLFACGRIGADAVEIRGERQHAERFKTYFPGP